MTQVLRSLALLLCIFVVSLCSAGTLTVTSPTNNSYASPSTDVTFNIANAVVQVTVTLTTTFPNGSSTSSTAQFLPSGTGTISGSMPANFSAGDPSGVYKLTVSATEPGATYTPTTLSVTLLPTAPQFNSFSPPDGTFISGVVVIRANINDAHLMNWKVQVGGADIPNNTGTGNVVALNWDTTSILQDGVQTITIVATDLASQSTTVTLSVTLCRTPPVLSFEYPGTGTQIVPGSTIPVVISVQGEFANAVDKTGIDVRVMTLTGGYVARVPLTSFVSSGSTTGTWTGRILWSRALPSRFKIMATCVDKAGNAASPQIQLVSISS